MVNGKTVNKKGYSLKSGDIVELSEKSRNMIRVTECVKRKSKLPQHIQLDSGAMKIVYLRHPEINELSHLEKLDLAKVIEYYNK
jgi:ribosomal protein S4